MVASAFLPVSIYKNQLYFLFGKESHDDSAPGFSDFGGGVNDNEDIFNAGLREMAEETTGFFGGPKEINEMIQKNGGVYPFVSGDYHIHIFRIDYDPNLIHYFNRSHEFVGQRINKQILKKSMIFEKVEIQWMTVQEMKRRRKEFRHFYRVILDKIIDDIDNIKSFIWSTVPKRNRKSRRNYN